MVVAVDMVVIMTMGQLVISVNVVMGMDVLVHMRMLQVTVTMDMFVGMSMLVGVLQGNSILHHQHCGDHHNHKADVKQEGRLLPQHQHAEHHS